MYTRGIIDTPDTQTVPNHLQIILHMGQSQGTMDMIIADQPVQSGYISRPHAGVALSAWL